MKIRKISTVMLSHAEMELLNRANELIESIYQATDDAGLIDYCDNATMAIADIMMMCEEDK